MKNHELQIAVVEVCENLRPTEFIPNPRTRYVTSTGNMAFNAYKYVQVLPEQTDVFVDKKIAPYVPYTNEPWTAARWHGKKNPNQGWWQRHVQHFAEELANRIGGRLE